jgi:hypothetical protein
MPNPHIKKMLDKYKSIGASRSYLDKDFIEFLNKIRTENKFRNNIEASKFIYDVFIKKEINNVKLIGNTKTSRVVEIPKGVKINGD